jgi:hypothetical protein
LAGLNQCHGRRFQRTDTENQRAQIFCDLRKFYQRRNFLERNFYEPMKLKFFFTVLIGAALFALWKHLQKAKTELATQAREPGLNVPTIETQELAGLSGQNYQPETLPATPTQPDSTSATNPARPAKNTPLRERVNRTPGASGIQRVH